MKLSVIIINYNAKELLKQCLASVQKTIDGIRHEIIIVDNNSGDGSRQYLTGIFHQVKTYLLEENVGFAKACNLGLKNSSGEFVLFLNPDTLLPPECFEKCLLFFDKTPQAGAIGVRMTDGSGKFLKESKRGFPSPATSFFKLFGFAKLFPHSKIVAAYYAGQLPEKETNSVDVLSGAFMMIRKKVLEETGGFDETFFMYGEDIDLSYRITRAGFKNYYLGEISITHFKGGSTRVNTNQVNLFYKAMKKFVDKYYKGRRSFLFMWMLYAGIWFRKMIAKAGLLFR